VKGDVLRRHPLSRILKQHDERDDEQDNDHPKGEIPEVRIHLRSRYWLLGILFSIHKSGLQSKSIAELWLSEAIRAPTMPRISFQPTLTIPHLPGGQSGGGKSRFRFERGIPPRHCSTGHDFQAISAG
jgi:hypothetical protein